MLFGGVSLPCLDRFGSARQHPPARGLRDDGSYFSADLPKMPHRRSRLCTRPLWSRPTRKTAAKNVVSTTAQARSCRSPRRLRSAARQRARHGPVRKYERGAHARDPQSISSDKRESSVALKDNVFHHRVDLLLPALA